MHEPSNMCPIITQIPGSDPIELIEYFDNFLSYYPNCEPQTKQWFVQNVQEDWCILDCGANIGYYSILFSRLASKGKIYAFEPTPTIHKLRKNLAYHEITNVTVIERALSERAGKFVDDIYQIWGSDPLHKSFQFTTIDDFIEEHDLKRLDCIKIDVDSYDFAVLRGAEKAVAKFNPYIMVELNHALNLRNENVVQALQWMHIQGYESAEVYDSENFLIRKGNKHKSCMNITLNFPEDDVP